MMDDIGVKCAKCGEDFGIMRPDPELDARMDEHWTTACPPPWDDGLIQTRPLQFYEIVQP